ncbi:recombinase RecT [Aminobacter anthyllidis]|uniref:Recombinase RecT n=1 Tax=Aminobacter anthyllidis TaxID=1035067 RepID=A0A9X1A6Y5_9HYPH|nr:recombinase RecT [Aminobacter anthyllidis]MBT1154318.1 recombinase RecT [Aminobacter anthyllidis]
MNALTKTEPQQKVMLLDFMADKYGLKPQEFADTVRKTCGLPTASNEEFAAFLMVAREYDLNPMLREIYAFPKQGGGIVPIVSIDGWVNLVNSHPACDGFEFDVEHEGKELVSITCHMYRKDRARPVVVTEYYDECKRDTQPWKMKHRMLRHKAMIQAARYAFGFSGIYDEDEGAKIADMRDVTPPPRPTVMRPPSPSDLMAEAEIIEHTEIVEETGEAVDAIIEGDGIDYGEVFENLQRAMNEATDAESVEQVWADFDVEAMFQDDAESRELADKIKINRLTQIHPLNGM